MAVSAWEEKLRRLTALKWRCFCLWSVTVIFFLACVLKGVFYIKLFILQLMPVEYFFFCTMVYAKEPCLVMHHGVQFYTCTLDILILFIHILRKMTLSVLPAKNCWIPILRLEEKY